MWFLLEDGTIFDKLYSLHPPRKRKTQKAGCPCAWGVHRSDRPIGSGWRRWSTAPKAAETLSAADLYELGTLYRSAASDLALAQRFPNGQVTTYLNQLVNADMA
ncbi:MAG: hypothetical protein R2856_35700 [Caldilineaceae bacterium]